MAQLFRDLTHCTQVIAVPPRSSARTRLVRINAEDIAAAVAATS